MNELIDPENSIAISPPARESEIHIDLCLLTNNLGINNINIILSSSFLLNITAKTFENNTNFMEVKCGGSLMFKGANMKI